MILESILKSHLEHKSIAGMIVTLTTGFEGNIYYQFYPIVKAFYLQPLLNFNSLRFFSLKKKISTKKYYAFLIFINFTQSTLSVLKSLISSILIRTKLNSHHDLVFYISAILVYIVRPTFFSQFNFAVCFLFWGTFYFHKDKKFLELCYYQLLAVIIICLINENNFSVTGFIIGLFLIGIFKKIFPLMLILFVFMLTPLGIYLDNFWWSIINFLLSLSKIAIWDQTSDVFLLLVCLILSHWKKSCYPLLMFFVFRSEWAHSPVTYYLK